MSEQVQDPIDKTVAMLNEMVTLDPRAWALFDVMVPCAPVVGHATAVELMGVHPKLAMVGVLGVVNGVLNDQACRISIITENHDGTTRRKFARTTTGPDTVLPSIEGSDAPAAPGPETPSI